MQGKNKQLVRYLGASLRKSLLKKTSILLLGPRQTGKTTLIKSLLKDVSHVKEYPLQIPRIRQEFERDPSLIIRRVLAQKVKPTVFIDEVQKAPELFDAIQYVIDEKKANFILTGSSARKLRKKQQNLLPGRIVYYHLDPLMWGELGLMRQSSIEQLRNNNINTMTSYKIHDILLYGSLPSIVTIPKEDRVQILNAYTQLYLEEEIRAEALSRNIGSFSRFLELSAYESGTAPNLRKLSNDSGVSEPSIKNFYQILEDTLIIERVDPFIRSARKRLFSSSRYYLFDIGVRNSLMHIPLTDGVISSQKGTLFEHAVMLELIRRVRHMGKGKVYYWRTRAGAEVDCILDFGDTVIPIEIKSGKHIAKSEIKGLKSFLQDYSKIAKVGYVVTMGDEPEQIEKNILAVPWNCL